MTYNEDTEEQKHAVHNCRLKFDFLRPAFMSVISNMRCSGVFREDLRRSSGRFSLSTAAGAG